MCCVTADLQARLAAECMWHGGVIAYPTEAVWGLGCDPSNQEACLRLLEIKHRPIEKGMILVAGELEQFAELLSPLSSEQQDMLVQSWAQQDKTGPITWLVPDLLHQVPYWIRGTHSAVALRLSGHSQVKQLCKAFGGPVVSTSANRAGMPPARTRVQVEKQLGADIDFVLPGRLGGATNPSRIVDLCTGKIMRSA
jgi:L-threonylcarbamoyladenylate synthase